MTVGAPLRAWITWSLILVAVVAGLLRIRQDADQAQIVLTMLLVVLGGSVAGGRPLGISLAVVSTLIIDYYFQEPYNQLTVPKPLDVIVLLAFAATAFVTTQLLASARQEADAASARASEVEALSRLGAETLRYASTKEAFDAITALVQRAIGATSCAILPGDLPARGVRSPTNPHADDITAGDVAERAIERARETGRPVVVYGDGTIREHVSTDIGTPANLTLRPRALALPLSAEDRHIGVLLVGGDRPFVLDGPRRRLLAALSYYAALGIERQRLISEAAYSEALQEAQQAKDEVFAAVSHDLRTPLTTIKVLAQSGIERWERSSAAIVEQADRLARLVSDLLEMSRMRAGGSTLVPELNTVEDLIGAALRQAEGIRNGRTIDVSIDFESPALLGYFDFVHTLRIVGNLLDNALRHSPKGARVELRAERENGSIVLSVGDRGVGIPRTERERIFQAFYRPADATLDGGHAGLGLSIARSLAERQGGSVEYVERPGGGSIFVLRLPAADVDDLGSELA